MQPHLSIRAGLGLGYRSAFYGYHQRGEVMHARYPDQVGGDNLDIKSYLPGSPRLGQYLPHGGRLPIGWPVSGGHRDTQDSVSVVP